MASSSSLGGSPRISINAAALSADSDGACGMGSPEREVCLLQTDIHSPLSLSIMSILMFELMEFVPVPG